MPSTKGYRSYHGRGRAGKLALVVVLCVLLLAAVGFLILQRYAVYGADGSIRFELPWSRPEKPADTDEIGGNEPEFIIVSPEEPEKTEPEELHAVALEETVLRGGADTALNALGENVNAVAVRLKNETGELLYASALSEAIDAGAVKGDAASLAAVEAVTESDYYAIARISALHDSLYSFAHMAEAGVLQLKYPGYIWYDPDSTFFLAPEKEGARAYLVSIARECAALGFDELLFDSFAYPARGRLANIDESARTMTRQAALALLAQELREGVAEYDVRLSLQLDAATVLAGGNETNGQELAVLVPLFDRIYVETTAEELPALTAALEPYEAELVPILKEPSAAGSYLAEA